MERCANCGRSPGETSDEEAHGGFCMIQNDVDCWRARAEALQVERDEAVALLAKIREAATPEPPGAGDGHDDDAICAKCKTLISVSYDCEWEDGDICDSCAHDTLEVVRDLARIDKGAES